MAVSTAPSEVPTHRAGCTPPPSDRRAIVSQKQSAVMPSRVSLSMLVTLELRERLKELSRWSRGTGAREAHTESRTVEGKKREKRR